MTSPTAGAQDGAQDGIERVLAVTAHPDDVDFGAGGTVATWTSAGIEVSYCIVTDGDAGGFDPAVPRSEIPGIRQAEQRAAGALLGVTDVTFLGYPDGRLTVGIALRRDISRVIRRVRPQRVVCQLPRRSWGRVFASHPDHIAAGEAALCAVYPDSRNPFAHVELLAEEGLDAWSVDEVWVMGDEQPDRFVDVTDTYDRKLAALRAHVSQNTGRADLPAFLRQRLADQAAAGGLPAGRLAEAFRVLDTRG